MPGFRNPSNRCFHCISHNAAGKEIQLSGFPENIRPGIRTDVGVPVEPERREQLRLHSRFAEVMCLVRANPTLFML